MFSKICQVAPTIRTEKLSGHRKWVTLKSFILLGIIVFRSYLTMAADPKYYQFFVEFVGNTGTGLWVEFPMVGGAKGSTNEVRVFEKSYTTRKREILHFQPQKILAMERAGNNVTISFASGDDRKSYEKLMVNLASGTQSLSEIHSERPAQGNTQIVVHPAKQISVLTENRAFTEVIVIPETRVLEIPVFVPKKPKLAISRLWTNLGSTGSAKDQNVLIQFVGNQTYHLKAAGDTRFFQVQIGSQTGVNKGGVYHQKLGLKHPQQIIRQLEIKKDLKGELGLVLTGDGFAQFVSNFGIYDLIQEGSPLKQLRSIGDDASKRVIEIELSDAGEFRLADNEELAEFRVDTTEEKESSKSSYLRSGSGKLKNCRFDGVN